ncbi:MAG: hypothetical protein IPN71_12440 [Fibrobacteres bacterium]|nr:hypothetical protein [Fibrobacterota bacterium]
MQTSRHARDLAQASLFSGMAGQRCFGAVYGLAAPLGGRLGAPMASFVPDFWFPSGRPIAKLGPTGRKALARYLDAARLLCDRPTQPGRRLGRSGKVSGLGRGDRGLSHWGMIRSDIPAMREAGLRASSMKGNPVDLLPSEIDAILEEAL